MRGTAKGPSPEGRGSQSAVLPSSIPRCGVHTVSGLRVAAVTVRSSVPQGSVARDAHCQVWPGTGQCYAQRRTGRITARKLVCECCLHKAACSTSQRCASGRGSGLCAAGDRF